VIISIVAVLQNYLSNTREAIED